LSKHWTLWMPLPLRSWESSENSSKTPEPASNWQSGRLRDVIDLRSGGHKWKYVREGCTVGIRVEDQRYDVRGIRA
jgi:hypothetical protein